METNMISKFGKQVHVYLIIFIFLFIMPGKAFAGSWEKVDDSSWCSEKFSFFTDSACEVRQININEPWKMIRIDANPNGSIKIEGWEKNNILIKVKVEASARSKKKAEAIISEIEIDADSNKIHADGPTGFNTNQYWSVSYHIMAPVKSNLNLNSVNGGISINYINGEISAKTVNGGIALEKISGDVEVSAVNGGITATLDGDRWQGKGIAARTTNGGIKFLVPEKYSADLKAGAVNGGIHIDFPVTIQGWITKNIDTKLGEGGAPISLNTVNGGVSIEKKQ
jgi:DUF4097 and DUF4098 domain-containing protein YvlB